MSIYLTIDNTIQKGYSCLLAHESTRACDHWLAAWADIMTLFDEGVAQDIFELDKVFNWSEFISNYAQELSFELHNAGISDKAYHHKSIAFCQDLLLHCANDLLITQNTRRALAEAYFASGDTARCDQLFLQWLHDDPSWGFGYIGWSDCYRLYADEPLRAKEEEILLAGLAQPVLCDAIFVAERLIDLCENMGRPDKARLYRKTYLTPLKNRNQVAHSAAKIGRNAPCHCGSGKKYKKCCGA